MCGPIAQAVRPAGGSTLSRSRYWKQPAWRRRLIAESCPVWPGSPVKVHWGYPDPSNAPGGDEGKRAAFELTRQAIAYRMLQLLQLPMAAMSNAELQRALNDIHRH